LDKQPKAIGPWRDSAWHRVGGLIAVGFPSDNHFLALSWNGRGLYDLQTSERIARDDTDPAGADWVSRDQLSVSGIGMFADQMIPIIGLWGGEGHITTHDGWRLETISKKGTVLRSSLIDPAGKAIPLPLTSITEYRAVSFNPSGQFLLLASTSEVQVLTRADEIA
jgi:hypothetical protein